MTKKFILSILFCFLYIFVFCTEVKIFHTSDIHGFYFPHKEKNEIIGGFASLATFLKTQKKPYLLLDSGDFTSGTEEAKESLGVYSVDFINKLKYNAITLGNHENDFKENALIKNILNLKTDILAVNFIDKNNLTKNKIKPYKIYDINGYKIAVIGVARDFSTEAKNIQISSWKKKLKKVIRQVLQKKPNAVILLAHETSNYKDKDDKERFEKLLKDIKGVNLFLGGHAHIIVQNQEIEGITCVESASYLKGVSDITLTFDDDTKELKTISSNFIILDNNKFPPDEEIKTFADSRYNKNLDDVIATTTINISSVAQNPDDNLDAPLAIMMADIMRKVANTDIGLINTRGVRKNLEKGEITRRDLKEIFPFSNTIVIAKVKGSFLEKVIRRGIKKEYSLLQYAGIKAEYTYKNDRVDKINIYVNNEKLNKENFYSLALPDFVAQGHGEGFLFKTIKDKKEFSSKYIEYYFEEYLLKNPTISVPQEKSLIRVK